MSGQIKMKPEQMRIRAGEYSTQANNLQSVITKMDLLLKELQGEWEGQASEAYAAKFAELRPGFVKAKELIEDISTSLKKTAQIMEEADSNIANQFKA